jgi:hypothetical protein
MGADVFQSGDSSPQGRLHNPLEIPKDNTEQPRWQAANIEPAQPFFTPRQQAAENKLLEEYTALTGKDRRERTATSLTDSVANLKQLGENQPRALMSVAGRAASNVISSTAEGLPSEEMPARRDVIASLTAIAELRLEGKFKPDKLPANHLNLLPQDSFVSSDKSLDLGGTGMAALTNAKVHVRRVEFLVDGLNGKTVDGKPVRVQEKQDMERVSEQIDKRIGVIEGPHDLDAAKTELQDYLRPWVVFPLLAGDERAVRRANIYAGREAAFANDFYNRPMDTAERILSSARQRGVDLSADPETSKLLAKLLRDQSFARLAHAELRLNEGDVGSAERILSGRDEKLFRSNSLTSRQFTVQEGLYSSDRLNPANPDLPKLWKMNEELQARLKAATTDRLK